MTQELALQTVVDTTAATAGVITPTHQAPRLGGTSPGTSGWEAPRVSLGITQGLASRRAGGARPGPASVVVPIVQIPSTAPSPGPKATAKLASQRVGGTTAGPSNVVTPTTQIGAVVNVAASRNERLSWFARRLDAEVDAAGRVGLATVDMYTFAIIHNARYYVMSINFKHPAFDIIDSAPATDTGIQMYGQAPAEMIDLFAAYLETKHQPVRALQLRSMIPTRTP